MGYDLDVGRQMLQGIGWRSLPHGKHDRQDEKDAAHAGNRTKASCTRWFFSRQSRRNRIEDLPEINL
jgi:hypothetical protein